MIRIITDSMSDYIHTPHRDPDVRIACQPVRFGMEEFMDDGATITQADFYARLHTCPELPKTSLVAMQTWKDALKDALANPDDTALIIAGSSKLSGGYQTAMQAQRWPKLSPLWRHSRDVSASSAWRTTSNTSSWAAA